MLQPPQALLSTIVSVSGFRYRLTRDDVLWAARMARFEGGLNDAPAVLWTLTQRLVWFADRGKRFKSFAELMQDFSQPINPRWRRDGSFCRPGGQYHGAEECSEARLARRDDAATRKWRNLPDDVKELVAKWSTGQVINPVPRSANFAASRPTPGREMSVAARYLENHPEARQVANYGGNTFIAEGGTRDWPDDYVGLENRDGSLTTTVITKSAPLAAFVRGLVSGSRIA